MPQLQGFSIKKRAVTATPVFPAVNGRETTVLTQAFPIWEFELTYEFLRTGTDNVIAYQQYLALREYEKIAAVFLACKGRYGRFFFGDPGDRSRPAQYIDTGDGVRTRFRVVRSLSSGALTSIEPVGGVDMANAISVTVNGSPAAPGSFYIDANDLQTLVFFSPPVGQIIMSFYYFYYCQFMEDIQHFEEFMANLHRVATLKFRSTKDCATDSVNPYMLV